MSGPLTTHIFPVSDLMAQLPICTEALSEAHPGPHYRSCQMGLIFNQYGPFFLHSRKKDSTRWIRKGGCSSRQPIAIFAY